MYFWPSGRLFLSTLSLRRATRFHAADISTRRISIHALLAESDRINARYTKSDEAFLSTLSLRRATQSTHSCDLSIAFLSTLSLRRATILLFACHVTSPYFYPRSPCGERRYIWPAYLQRQIISIHALLAESDHEYHNFG